MKKLADYRLPPSAGGDAYDHASNLRAKLIDLQFCVGGRCPECRQTSHHDACELAALLAIRLDLLPARQERRYAQ